MRGLSICELVALVCSREVGRYDFFSQVEMLPLFGTTFSLTWIALSAVSCPQTMGICSPETMPHLAASFGVRVPYVSTSSCSPMPATGKSLLRVKKMIEVRKKPTQA